MRNQKEKTMRDALGNDVPLRYVSKYDRLRDTAVRKILKRWQAARAELEDVMEDTLTLLDEIALARGETGASPAEKGNFQVSSFDGNITVALTQRYEIRLDDRVAQAREKMYGYARGLVEKVGGEDGKALFEIIKQAFEASKTGNLSIARIANLLKMNIANQQWTEAKQILTDAMTPAKGKCYLRVEHRPDRQHDMQGIRLDIADCWQKEGGGTV